MDSLTFLESPPRGKPQSLYVLHGDETFLKRQVLAALRISVLGPTGSDFGLSTLEGDKTSFSEVRNELETLPFVGTHRLVVVDNADPFVTTHRAALEKLVQQLPASGVLVLDVKTWVSTTRLAKLVPASATIICKTPPTAKLPPWCVQWAAGQHGKQLSAPAAALLIDLVGPDLGLLDQELTKLAIYVGKAGRIDKDDVDKLVGCSRDENMWKVFDAIGAGQLREALAIVDRLLDQGEEPLRILGAFSMQLRRLAQAGRLAQQGQALAGALEQAGVPPFVLRSAEQQLRHLGQRRANRLYDWLLEMDLGLKGGSKLPPKTLLERFVVQLARK